MTNGLFFRNLILLASGWTALLWLLPQLFPVAPGSRPMIPYASLLFVLLCAGIFLFARKSLHSPNASAFNGVVMGSVLVKMIAALAFLFAYRALLQPADKWFVGIFLLHYLAYTAFEVWALHQLAKR